MSEHLATCDQPHVEARDLIGAGAALAASAGDVDPSPGLRDRLMTTVAETPQEHRPRAAAAVTPPAADAEPRRPWWRMQPVAMGIAAVALLLVIGLGAWGLNLNAQLAEREDALRAVANADAAFAVSGSAGSGLGHRVGRRRPLRRGRPRRTARRADLRALAARRRGKPDGGRHGRRPRRSRRRAPRAGPRQRDDVRGHRRAAAGRGADLGSGARGFPRGLTSAEPGAAGASASRTLRSPDVLHPRLGARHRRLHVLRQDRRDAAPAPTLLHRRPRGRPGEAAPRHADR